MSKKKLLVATVGLAAVNYACQEKPITTGNLVAPPPPSAEPSATSSVSPQEMPVGNLVAPPPMDDAGAKPRATDAGIPEHRFRTGNLMPPPPRPPPSATKK